MKRLFRLLARSRPAAALRVLFRGSPPPKPRDPFWAYDKKRFRTRSGAADPEAEESMRGLVCACYHVIEKGICMPDRKLGFGRNVVIRLIRLVERFEARFGTGDGMVAHAVAVLREYRVLHDPIFVGGDSENALYWEELDRFLATRQGNPAVQTHVRRDDFFAKRNAPFPELARARRTVRNYLPGVPVPPESIRRAVDIARETPSSCNRQPCRVRVVSDSATMAKILELQGGSRGFGHLASTLLVVTVDLADATHERERMDPFICGGMFLMTLSYALFHEQVAHCILNWSRTPAEDLAFRKLVPIAPSESVAAVLSCGIPPDEFDVCASPRKPLSAVLVGERSSSADDGTGVSE